MVEARVGNTAVLCIDCQYDFIGPAVEGTVGNPNKSFGLHRTLKLLNDARSKGIGVIHVKTVHRTEDTYPPELRNRGISLCPEGSPHSEIVIGLYDEDDRTIVKTQFSAFRDTELKKYLDDQGFEVLIVCGIATDCCVRRTVEDAQDEQYSTYIPYNTTSSTTCDKYVDTLTHLQGSYGNVIFFNEDIFQSINDAQRYSSEIFQNHFNDNSARMKQLLPEYSTRWNDDFSSAVDWLLNHWGD